MLDFIDFILTETTPSNAKEIEATDQEILRAIESSGTLDFYYDDSREVYTFQEGEPLCSAAILFVTSSCIFLFDSVSSYQHLLHQF